MSWRLEGPLQDLELGLVLETLVLEVVDDIGRAGVDILPLLLGGGCGSWSGDNSSSLKKEVGVKQ